MTWRIDSSMRGRGKVLGARGHGYVAYEASSMNGGGGVVRCGMVEGASKATRECDALPNAERC